MAGKRIRSRNSQNSIPVTNLTNRTTIQTAKVTNTVGLKVLDDLLTLTKEQLKAECRRRGQKTTGTKVELLQRLGHKMIVNNKRNVVPTTNGNANLQNEARHSNAVNRAKKQKEREEMQDILLYKQPVKTLEYFIKELFFKFYTYGKQLLQYRKVVLLLVISVLSFTAGFNVGGPHQFVFQSVYKQLIRCLYWIGLGILSSVGLGTGLHTFVLYLGPHIAKVTLAAYECGSLNFPSPPYPDEIVCSNDKSEITVLAIVLKVSVEAICWGAGTALGELPPYFMAKAARLSGHDPDDDDELREFEELQHKEKERLTFIERVKLSVENLVQRVGFFGILACASIPNPLFDLAGITCGHFLVPFWTFFGATVIGKAGIKMLVQTLFVIFAFNENLINAVLQRLSFVPYIGEKLQIPFRDFLDNQKARLHGTASKQDGGGFVLKMVFEGIVGVMVVYFVISIIHSLAQSHFKRVYLKKASAKARD